MGEFVSSVYISVNLVYTGGVRESPTPKGNTVDIAASRKAWG